MMKRLSMPAAMLPGAAFAHGGHMEVSGAAHEAYHGLVYGAIGVVAVVIILALARGLRS